MKILYQHRTLADGAEGIHIAEMIESFERLGHHVVVEALATSHARGEGRPSRWGAIKRLLPPALFELAAAAYNVVEYAQFRRALARHRPDLVYKRHAIYDVGIAMACRHAGVPMVLEVNCPYSSARHQQFEKIWFPRLLRRIERRAFSLPTLVTTVSTPLGDHIREISGGRARVLVTPNGANPSRFTPKAAPEALRRALAPGGEPLIGWVGILRSWHRVDLLLDAVARLPHVRVVIIGDGPDREPLEQHAQSAGVASRVHFAGRIPHAEMPDYIAALDIAVAADDRTGYASPMKLLEYMAMAKPIVAPRLRNIEDFVTHGVDGLLFAPGDAGDFARVLDLLARDPELRRRYGQAARARIERDRNWDAIARTVLAEAAPLARGAGHPIPEAAA